MISPTISNKTRGKRTKKRAIMSREAFTVAGILYDLLTYPAHGKIIALSVLGTMKTRFSANSTLPAGSLASRKEGQISLRESRHAVFCGSVMIAVYIGRDFSAIVMG